MSRKVVRCATRGAPKPRAASAIARLSAIRSAAIITATSMGK
jgi:hypothetical protein